MGVPTGQYRYYDGMLYMLAMMHVGGRFELYYRSLSETFARARAEAPERGAVRTQACRPAC
jgi:hypothetical protein